MKTKYLLIVLIFCTIVSNSYGQSEYSYGLNLKSFQADFTSFILINGATIYSDIDVIKLALNKNSFGFRLELEAVHAFGLVHPVEGFPIRNLGFSIRSSLKPKKLWVNTLVSYINTHSFYAGYGHIDGNNLRFEIEAINYFKYDIGLKFKLQIPVFNLQGKRTGWFIGFGVVAGYLNN
ncbi:MAG: hypothetical protein ACFFD1_08520 [Candidatus Thorarchaeota archaeon]